MVGEGVHWKHMLLAVVVILFATIAGGLAQGAAPNSLTSSLDQGNGMSRSACPGEEVTYTCTIVDVGGGRSTLWQGSAFNCSDVLNRILLAHPDFIIPGGTDRQCGALTAQSQSVDGNCYTSILTVPESAVTEDLDGATIGCFLSPMTLVGEKTLTVISLPAPNITITELTPESVRISLIDYPEETLNCNLTFTVEGTTPGGAVNETTAVPPQSNDTVTVEFRDLNLCTDVYFKAIVMSGSKSSPMTIMPFSSNLTSLDNVANVRSDSESLTLLWDAPANTPDSCNVNYVIEVTGDPTSTTTDTSIPTADLDLGQFCTNHTITVVPEIRNTLVENSRSEQFTLTPAAVPFPSDVALSEFTYTDEAIVATIMWGNAATLGQLFNTSVQLECSMDDCDHRNEPGAPSSLTTNISYEDAEAGPEFITGEEIEFAVTFIHSTCERIARSDPMTFMNILTTVVASKTTNSTDFLVTYRPDIHTSGDLVIVATVYLLGDSINNPVGEPLEMDFPPVNTLPPPHDNMFEIPNYTGLEPGTDYMADVRIVGRTSHLLIGRQRTNRFSTTPDSGINLIPSSSSSSSPISAIIGGVVGGVVLLILVIILVVVIVFCVHHKPHSDTETPYKSEKLMELKSQVTRPDEDTEVTTDTCVAYGAFTGRARAPPPEATYEVVADPNPAYHTVLQAGGTASQEHA